MYVFQRSRLLLLIIISFIWMQRACDGSEWNLKQVVFQPCHEEYSQGNLEEFCNKCNPTKSGKSTTMTEYIGDLGWLRVKFVNNSIIFHTPDTQVDESYHETNDTVTESDISDDQGISFASLCCCSILFVVPCVVCLTGDETKDCSCSFGEKTFETTKRNQALKQVEQISRHTGACMNDQTSVIEEKDIMIENFTTESYPHILDIKPSANQTYQFCETQSRKGCRTSVVYFNNAAAKCEECVDRTAACVPRAFVNYDLPALLIKDFNDNHQTTPKDKTTGSKRATFTEEGRIVCQPCSDNDGDYRKPTTKLVAPGIHLKKKFINQINWCYNNHPMMSHSAGERCFEDQRDDNNTQVKELIENEKTASKYVTFTRGGLAVCQLLSDHQDENEKTQKCDLATQEIFSKTVSSPKNELRDQNGNRITSVFTILIQLSPCLLVVLVIIQRSKKPKGKMVCNTNADEMSKSNLNTGTNLDENLTNAVSEVKQTFTTKHNVIESKANRLMHCPGHKGCVRDGKSDVLSLIVCDGVVELSPKKLSENGDAKCFEVKSNQDLKKMDQENPEESSIQSNYANQSEKQIIKIAKNKNINNPKAWVDQVSSSSATEEKESCNSCNPKTQQETTEGGVLPIIEHDVQKDFHAHIYQMVDELMKDFQIVLDGLDVEEIREESTKFLGTIEEICRKAYHTNCRKPEEILASALHVVNSLSLYQFELLTTEEELLENADTRLILVYTCFLLKNLFIPKLVCKHNNADDWYLTKLDITRSLIQTQIKGIRRGYKHEKLDTLKQCVQEIDDPMLEKLLLQKQRFFTGSSKRSTSTTNLVHLTATEVTVADGSIYDRARDPPGQRSVYIPPGDQARETYRLSTFIKYPQEIPVNPRHLASAGFFYTGYKDRVKCFSCGLCVENWAFGDDVKSKGWHRSDCAFIRGEDSGNVPIGGGGYARFMMTNQSGSSSSNAMETAPPESSNNNAASTSTATQVGRSNQTPSAGSVLLQQSQPTPVSHTHTPHQTARPMPSQNRNAPLFQTVEFATIASAYHENFVKNLDLRKETERNRTYEHWPTDRLTVRPNDLAKSGFFYLGNLDRVQCFSCGGVLRNWNYGDSVQSEHRRHFPHCRMVQGTENRNVPLTPEQRAANPGQQPVFTEPPDPTEEETRDLRNMFPCQYPVNPHMRNEETRMETFDHRWPAAQVNATPGQISKAGFFFLGDRDRVKCWYCNGGLQNWDPEDEPWTEHAKWFPTCEFLLQRKGPDFVHRMVSMFPNLPRPLLRGPFDVPPPAPGRRIAFGSNSARAPSPPPQIIDPQAELQREKEKIRAAMTSEIVKAALEMGFERRLIKRIVKRRIRRTEMYTTVAELIEDATSAGNNEDSDDSDEEAAPSMTSQPQATAVKSHGSGEARSLEHEMRGQPLPSANAATSRQQEMETSEEQSPSMQARIRELQEERKCKICLDKEADIVFVPCGHLCSCGDCAQALRKCPMCRKKIEKAIRTYMS